MKFRAIPVFAALALFVSATLYVTFSPVGAEAPATPLQGVIEEVARKFPEVTHVDQWKFEAMKEAGDVVVFDARSAEEYAVSHLDGAVHVDPKISAQDFATSYASAIKGNTAVVYCSVGMRSSRLAARLAEVAKSAGASAVVNLKGGIFAWANASRPLVDARGPTTNVHGYDAKWGKFLEKK